MKIYKKNGGDARAGSRRIIPNLAIRSVDSEHACLQANKKRMPRDVFYP